MAEEATKHLEEQELKLQEIMAEMEKKKKAKKGKKDQEEELDPTPFKYLPKDLLRRMLAKRLQEDDCNAGAIFDNLTCQYWPDEKFGIELICDSVPQQNVEVVLFTFNKEKGESEDGEAGKTHEVCTNYRYARRHDAHHRPQDDEKKEERQDSAALVAKRPSKVQQKAKGGKQPNKKDVAQIEAEEKAAREAEEQERLKEAEDARKQAEESARAAYRPKSYSNEEKNEWAKQKEDLEQFFSSIVVRQTNSSHPQTKVSDEAGAEEKKDGEDAAAPAKSQADTESP